MKNANEIKAEAKEQIIKLLKMCDCYKFKEEYIDEWLNVWERACSPQIEAIAEKSPYYDGKCKIVFPSEYPREFNVTGIHNFVYWLENYPNRAVERIEPVRVDGFTYRELKSLGVLYNNLAALRNLSDCSELLEGEFKEMYSRFLELYDTEIIEQNNKRDYAWRKIKNLCDINIINQNAYYLDDMESLGISQAKTLMQILDTSRYQMQFLDDELSSILNRFFPDCKFAKGQKLSRAVNSIAAKYGINKDPDWNKEFAKFADAINPLTITKWTVISWHPLDYLTFCFGNSWSTCSTIDKKNVRGVKIGNSRSSITSYVDEDYMFHGEHSAAALSYMFDKASFIYYTVNHKYDGNHYEEQDKESRIVFSLSEDNSTLLQSRLYPQCNDDNPNDSAYRIPREIVQKIIADALELPNLWKVKTGSRICRQVCESNGVHYNDWSDERNSKVNISWLTELTDEPKTIRLGHSGICPNCGENHWHASSLNCEECDPMY